MPNSLTGTPPPEGLEQFMAERSLQEEYGSTGQQVIAGLEGAAQGVLGPIAPAIERGLGVDPADIRGRAEANPKIHGASQVAGFVGSSLATMGAGAVLTGAGKAGAAAVGLGNVAKASTASKIGAMAVTNAIEGAGFAASDELSKMVLSDPNQTLNSAIAGVGMGGLLGGVVGAGLGTVPPLWKAAKESEVGGLLKSITGKVNEADAAAIRSPVQEAIDALGIKLAPEAKAALSDDPIIQQIAKTLEQSDTSSSGRAFQESLKKFKTELSTRAEEVLAPYGNRLTELSKHEAGKRIGTTLADEISSRVSPLSREFNQIKTNFADAVVHTVDHGDMSEALGQLALKEGWMVSPSSDIAKQVNTIMSELPNIKNLKNLSEYIEAVGQATSKNPLDRSLMRQGGLIKDVLRAQESKVIERELGDLFPDLLGRFRDAQRLYAKEAKLKDALDSRLHLKGSTHGFADRVREAATTDPETLLRRLSGKGDADLLNLLSETYPKTAEELRKHIVDEVLDKAASKAKPGEAINPNTLVKTLEGMEPEMRNFAFPKVVVDKIDAVSKVIDKLSEMPHNFSNTARTLDKLMTYVPASAVGAVAMAMGHNPILSVVAGGLAKALGKDVPDAMRLALLKFMGTEAPVSGSAFKSAFDYIRKAAQGSKMIDKASEAVFKGGEVIPMKFLPTPAKRKMIDEAVKVAEVEPERAINSSGEIGYYMQDQAEPIGTTSARVISYLSSIRPRDERVNPLDTNKPINSTKQAEYNRALDIAEQPTMILKHIADGTLTSKDVAAGAAMHPGFMSMISQKLLNNLTDTMAKGDPVPYRVRIGLATLAQMPLDGTMTPMAIAAAQPPPQPPLPQAQNGPKANPSKLNKLDTLSMTAEQGSLARKSGLSS